MPQPPKLSKQDIELFRAAVKDVKPFFSNQVPIPQKKILQQTNPHPAADLPDRAISHFEKEKVSAEHYIQFVRAGVQKKYFSKLQRGKIPIQAVLDLHNLTTDQAWLSLGIFLQACLAKKLRVIKIIHGKGYRSVEATPVLKNKIYLWLQQLPEVLAFCSAQPKDGGTGAVYVLLKLI